MHEGYKNPATCPAGGGLVKRFPLGRPRLQHRQPTGRWQSGGLMRGDCALLSAFYNARALGKPPCTALHILRAPRGEAVAPIAGWGAAWLERPSLTGARFYNAVAITQEPILSNPMS